MRQFQFIRSKAFQWAAAVAVLLALIITMLFGFIYWKIDSYLIARSDRMIVMQVDFFARLPGDRRVSAIDEHLMQDSRGVQFGGLFDSAGRRIAGNLGLVPHDIQPVGPPQNVRVTRAKATADGDPMVRAVARRLPNGDMLVMGRNVDETREISQVVGEALAFGLIPALSLCLLAGVWLSIRAQRRVEEVNERVQRIIAGDLRERLPHSDVDEPFSRLAVIVNGMLDEMESMINALAGIGNDIAHDLRTPLTRARLALERGRANATTLQHLQEAADKAVVAIDQSLAIITALLRLAEIENSRRSAAFASLALHDLVREVCEIYEPIAEDKQIGLSVETAVHVHVHADRDLLFEALANLVDNAIKFTPEGGKVKIGLLRDKREVIMRVSDTGPGINTSEREAVLRRFYRSDKMRNTPGVGLGLNLVAAIAKLHDFRLIIHTGPGGRIDIVCPEQRPVA
jgi:signal transduction histidine kinase